jgi:hypothetical protein
MSERQSLANGVQSRTRRRWARVRARGTRTARRDGESDATASVSTRAARLAGRQREWSRIGPLVLVAIAVAFNLFVLRAEVRPVAPPNDTSVHVSMVRFAEQKLLDGKLVFDSWYPRLSMGLPQFHHYQSLAPIVSGAIATQFGAARTVAWSNYLLVCLLPVAFYLAIRIFGFDKWVAGIAALLVPLLHSVTLYGYEHGSFQWRGNGIWTALWGAWLLPFALALSYRAVSQGRSYALAALAVGMTMSSHFLTGYLVILALGVWVLVQPSDLLRRIGRAAIVAVGGTLVGAWVVVPLLADSKWSNRTEYNVNTFWFDSAGGGKVMTWLSSGRVFDYQHWPIVTVLAAVGAIVCIWRFRFDERARAILGFSVLALLLFCGRNTIGFVIDRLPGGKDLLLHRYIIGVHLGGIVLAAIGTAWLARAIIAFVHGRFPRVAPAVAGAVLLLVTVAALAPVWRERTHYDALNAAGIDSQQVSDATDGRDFTVLVEAAKSLGGGRVYAGSPATAASIGSVPAYSYVLRDEADGVGFYLRTLSLSTDVETRFDSTNPAHYDLFNARYLIQPLSEAPRVRATFLRRSGRWGLWTVPTSGYLQVVDTTSAIIADRTNLGRRTAGFLSSRLPGDHLIPVIAFAGKAAAPPTAAFGKQPGPAGLILEQHARPDDGVFGGRVIANRQSVVMLKATYDPRLKVTVDGRASKTQMLAPSYIGVAVAPGAHDIEFRYEAYPYYWELIVLGLLTLVVLALAPRYGRQWTAALRQRARTPRFVPQRARRAQDQ